MSVMKMTTKGGCLATLFPVSYTHLKRLFQALSFLREEQDIFLLSQIAFSTVQADFQVRSKYL